TFIDREVKIGRDTVIYPFTYIEGRTSIGQNTIVGPSSRIVESEIGSNVELKAKSHIWHSIIKDNCTIGPFAYIRPGCNIKDGAKIGDFVELKKAEIGDGSKVPHLSYVGDASVGENCNIGAGTIFANYDGEKKHQTTLGDRVFIGSNTTLVAPVNVGDGGKTGAGSVVVHNVDKDTVVLGVPARKHKKVNEKQSNN
ncbi:MAG: DapH/DapD/GlmU-related protein, partial [Halanaerobiales bacterium]